MWIGRRVRPLVGTVASAVALSGCGAEPNLPVGGIVDTVASGAVRVRNPAQGLWTTSTAWTLTEDLRLGSAEGTGPDVFGNVVGVAAAEDGGIYVLDGLTHELRAFSADGIHRWTAGRKGEGPGEFMRPTGVAVDGDGLVWVVDRLNRRYSAFDRDGKLVQEARREVGGPILRWRGAFDDRGRLLDAAFVTMKEGLLGDGVVRTDTALRPADALSLPDMAAVNFPALRGGGVSFAPPVPFSAHDVWAPAPDGNIWRARTDRYRLALVSFQGDTLRIVERAAEELPLSIRDKAYADSILRDLQSRGGRPDPSLVPKSKPRILWLDPAPDGHLWVRAHGAASAVAYDVFDPDGRYLGEVAAPEDLAAGLVFTDQAVVGVARDNLGVPYVVRMRINRPAPPR